MYMYMYTYIYLYTHILFPQVKRKIKFRKIILRHILFVFLIAKNYYGVATISRLPKIIGLFCKRALLKRLCSAKETYKFKERTNRCHPIARMLADCSRPHQIDSTVVKTSALQGKSAMNKEKGWHCVVNITLQLNLKIVATANWDVQIFSRSFSILKFHIIFLVECLRRLNLSGAVYMYISIYIYMNMSVHIHVTIYILSHI